MNADKPLNVVAHELLIGKTCVGADEVPQYDLTEKEYAELVRLLQQPYYHERTGEILTDPEAIAVDAWFDCDREKWPRVDRVLGVRFLKESYDTYLNWKAMQDPEKPLNVIAHELLIGKTCVGADEVPRYDTDIAAAWLLADDMVERGLYVVTICDPDGIKYCETYSASDGFFAREYAKTIPMAITQAYVEACKPTQKEEPQS